MKLHLLFLLIFLVECRACPSKDSEAGARTKRAAEISRLEGQLKWLNQADVDMYVSYIYGLCFSDSPLTRTVCSYMEARRMEKSLVAAGFGENHPRLKSVRVQKRLEADRISAHIEEARTRISSSLAELRKQSQREK